jgi:hypothetical protein
VGRRPNHIFVCVLTLHMGNFSHTVIFLPSRPEASADFTVSVLMEVGESERQLLGFIELNGREFYDDSGNSCGRSNNPGPFAFSK